MSNMFTALVVQEKSVTQKPSPQEDYYSWFEFLEVCKKHGIMNQYDYNNLLPFDTRLPSGPSKKYQPHWNAAGGWKGVVQEYRKTYYDFPRFLELCKILGITDEDSYKIRARQNTKLPNNPSITYRPQWQNAGEWNCLKVESRVVHTHLCREHYSFDEFLIICKQRGFKGKVDYQSRRQIDPKLPSHPETHYKGHWEEKGGWGKIFTNEIKKGMSSGPFIITLKKINTQFDEFVKICKEMKIVSRKDYFERYKQNPKLISNPEKRYHEWFERVGGWGFITGRDFYTFLKFLEVCKQFSFVNREDYKRRHKSDPKLTRFPSILYTDEWLSAGEWRCISK